MVFRYLKNIGIATVWVTTILGFVAWFIASIAGCVAYFNPSWHYEGFEVVRDTVHFWYLVPALAFIPFIIIILGVVLTKEEVRTIEEDP